MLSPVKSRWVTLLAGAVVAVVMVSVALGLATPDGRVGGAPTPMDRTGASPSPRPSDPATTPTPTPTATPRKTPPSRDLAPASVRGAWPGRPDSTGLDGSTVDWCPAVRTRGAGDAENVFGAGAVDTAACTAVEFIFEQRYSRLALPRKTYSVSDFDFVLPALTRTTAGTVYSARVRAFVANPRNAFNREAVGIVLFLDPSAGEGRTFYGKPRSTTGYKHRAVWINPTWSRVSISVDRTKAAPRIVAVLDATASVPVFNDSKSRDDMLTVPTHALFYLRRSGPKSWKIGGWNIDTGSYSYARLKVN